MKNLLIGRQDRFPGMDFLLPDAQAVGCTTSDISVELHRVNSQSGQPEIEIVASTSIKRDGSYSFGDLLAKGVDVTSSSQHYVVIVSGCFANTIYQRNVTSYEGQDVTAYSSLIASLATASPSVSQALLRADPMRLEAFLKKLTQSLGAGQTSVALAYQALVADGSLTSEFQSLFAVSPSVLRDAAPQVIALQMPTSVREHQGTSFSVNTWQWDTSYAQAVLWKLGNKTLSRSSQFIYTPDANSQGNQTLTLWVGQDDGSGNVNLAKPYFVQSRAILIEDTIPATPPSFTISGSNTTYTSNRTITLTLNTGGNFANCESFSGLAITENAVSAPLSPTAYSISCTTAISQAVSYTLTSPGDGTKTVQLWAIDASGTQSVVPASASIILDTASPAVSLTTSIASAIRGGDTIPVSFLASDSGTGVSALNFEFAQDGTNFSTVASLSPGAGVYSWTVPLLDISGAKVRITAADQAGNTSNATSNTIAIVSTPPAPPAITLASASPTSSLTGTLSVASCGGGRAFILARETAFVPDRSDSAWVPCTTSGGGIPFSLSSAIQGSHTVQAFAKDAVGNVSATGNSSSVIYDTVAPIVSLASLTGGQTIGGGSSQIISWTASDSNLAAGPISLDYSLDSGSTWTSIASGIANSGSYAWSVPAVDSTTVRVRVSAADAAGNVARSASNSNFIIDSTAPSVTLTSLTGGQSLAGGSTQTITWTASDPNFGTTPIALEYSSDGGTSWSSIASSLANAGSYAWSVPALNGATFRLRVSATDRAGNTTRVSSSTNFVIDSTSPSVSLTSLTGGQVFAGGTTQAITWSASDSNFGSNPISLGYSRDSGATWVSIASSIGNTGTYSWTIPTGLDGTQYRVRVSATDIVGHVTQVSSSSDFTVDSASPILSLNTLTGGQTLAGGSTTSISWTATAANLGSNPIDLDYSTDSGANWISIATGLANTGSYAWSVPSLNISTVRLRVSATNLASTVSRFSSASDLTIDSVAPSVSLTSLNGGEVLSGGATQVITWSASDAHFGAAPIAIGLSLDGGLSYSSIASGLANSGTFTWTVPSSNGSTYRIRITATDLAGHASSSSSSANFSIDSTAPSVSLTSLTGGQVLKGGSIQGITWSASDSNLGTAPITLDVSSDSGATWSSVASNLANSGSYSWTTPSSNGTHFRIRVTATDQVGHSTQAVSSADFSIDSAAPVLSVTNPANLLKGGSSITLNYSATDAISGLTSLSLQFSSDGGSTWGSSTPLLTGSSSTTWSIPSLDTTQAVIRLTATDSVGWVGTATTSAFAIDSTPPSVPTATLASATPTNQASGTVTVTSSCTGIAGILVNESASALSTDSGWQACTNAAGGLSFTLASLNEGLHTLRVWSKDLAGNVSSSPATLTLTYDITPPAPVGVTLSSATPTNSSSVTLTVASCSDVAQVLVNQSTQPQASDSAWVGCSTGASAVAYSLVNPTDGAQSLKVWFKDPAGNVSTAATSVSLTYDSTPPAPPSIALSSNNPTNSASVSLTVADCTDRAGILINESGTQPASSASGWVACTTSVSGTVYSLQGSTQGTRTLYAWAKDTAGNVSNSAGTASTVFDTIPPAAPSITLATNTPTNAPGVGLTTANCTDTAYLLVNEGSQPAAGASGWQICSTAAGAITYTVSGDGTHNLKIWAKDAAGNVQSTAGTASMVLDTTPPVPPTVTLASGTPTRSTTVQLTVSSCADIAGVLINESTTPPLSSDSAWQPCSTSVGSLAYLAPWPTDGTSDGNKSIKVWFKDSVGNVTTSATSVALVFDTTPPPAPTLTLSSAYASTTSLTGTIASCAAGGTASILIGESSTPPTIGDSRWSSCTTATNGTSYTLLDTTQGSHTLYVWAKDVAGNISSSSSVAVVYDTVAPTIGSFTINGGNAYSSGATVPVSITATDATSGVSAYMLSLSNTFSGATWSSSPPTTYSFPFLSGAYAYTLYLKVKDSAGNISAVSSASVSITIGQPPLVSFIRPLSTQTYTAAGQTVHISWNTTLQSSAPLAANGINLYATTDDGVTLTDWDSTAPSAGKGLQPTTNGSCTLDSGASGCVDLVLPSARANQKFRLVLQVLDTAGNQSQAMSTKVNAPAGVSLLAGNLSTPMGGAALSTALNYGSSGGSMVRDPLTGDVYLSRNSEILRIDGATGRVTSWAGSPTATSGSTNDGVAPGNTRFQIATFTSANRIAIDSQRNIYWTTWPNYQILKYDRAKNQVFVWVGPVLASPSRASGTSRRQFNFNSGYQPWQVLIGKNDVVYFSVVTTNSCDNQHYQTELYRLEPDTLDAGGNITAYGTATLLAGNETCVPNSSPAPTNNMDALTAYMRYFTVRPGDNTREDRIFIDTTGANAIGQTLNYGLYELVSGLLVSTSSVPTHSFVGRYLSSYQAFAIHSGSGAAPKVSFWDPDNPARAISTATTLSTGDYKNSGNSLAWLDVLDDASGGILYTTDLGNLIRYLAPSTYALSTFAGIAPNYGNGVAATSAELRTPDQIGMDSSNNLYIRDYGNALIRKVNSSGIITTVTGFGSLSNTYNLSSGQPLSTSFSSGLPVVSQGYNAQLTSAPVVSSAGTCLYACNGGSTNPSGTTVSYSNAANLDRGDLFSVGTTFSGSDMYVMAQQRSGSTFKCTVRLVSSSGAYSTVAGDTTAALMTTQCGAGSVPGTAVSSSYTASSFGNNFNVVNGVIYLVNGGNLITGSASGNWVTQKTGVSNYTVDSRTSNFYYISANKLYRAAYVAAGGATANLVVDFTGYFSSSAYVLAVDYSLSNTLIIRDGNQLFRYTDSTGVP